jgi:hypothetical protein
MMDETYLGVPRGAIRKKIAGLNAEVRVNGRRDPLESVEEVNFYTECEWNRYKDGRCRARHGAKSRGRSVHRHVGDSPVIGAGAYANNDSCAVSSTGTGEYFMGNNLVLRSAAMAASSRSTNKATSPLPSTPPPG